MTLIPKCPDCGSVLGSDLRCMQCGTNVVVLKRKNERCHFVADRKCHGNVSVRINDSWMCGWHFENGYDAQLRTGEKIPQVELKRRKALAAINEEVAKYQQKHVGASKKDACFALMKSMGLLHVLPSVLRDQEAISERQAIQMEDA